MKIFEVIPSFTPLGGAENFVYNLSLALKQKAEIYVISLYDKENEYISNSLQKHGIRIIYLHKKSGFDLKCPKAFSKQIELFKPDIVHLHLNTFFSCLPSILKRKSKYLFTFHTFVSKATYGNRHNFSNVILKLLFKKEYVFPITISDSIDASVKAFFPGIATRIVYNGIDTCRYAYRSDVSKKYTFISIGSFNDIKNNLFMIKCVHSLISKGFDINYLILGNGKNFNCCKEYCLDNGIEDRILMLGQVNNVEDYLCQSKCLLLASHWEGNPLVVNEAISSGVWVVANNVGGVKDLINETNGFLVTPENRDDFINKMEKFLLKEKDIISSIIPKNIEHNRKKVALENSRDGYFKIMYELLG